MTVHRGSAFRSVSRVAVGVLAAAVLATPALAQGGRGGGGPGGGGGGGPVMMRMGGGMGMGMGRDMWDPPVNSADVDRYAQILGLSADQKEAARALLEASMAEFQPAARKAREQMELIREEFRDTRDPSVWQGMGPIMQDFRQARTGAEKAFMEDLQILLTEAQSQKWPRVERTHRRERTIGMGLMGGERVDLFKLVEGMELSASEREAVAPLLDQYEQDLDRELVKRNELFEQGMTEGANLFQRAMQDPEGQDMQRINEMMNRGREAAMRVRDVNRRYARQVESSLSDRNRQAFSDAFKRESFPMIYRDTYATRVLSAAAGFDDLDDTQRASITALRESFARDVAAVNAKLQAAQEEREETATPMSFFGGGDQRGQDLRRQRRDLEQQTIQRVRDLLTETQRERLPQRNEEAEAGGMQFDAIEAPRRRRGGEDEAPPQRRGGGRGGERGEREGGGPPPPRNPR